MTGVFIQICLFKNIGGPIPCADIYTVYCTKVKAYSEKVSIKIPFWGGHKPGLCGSSSKVSVTYAIGMHMPFNWVFVEAYMGTITSPQQGFITIMKDDGE